MMLFSHGVETAKCSSPCWYAQVWPIIIRKNDT